MGCDCSEGQLASAWVVVDADTGECLLPNGSECVDFASAELAVTAAEAAGLTGRYGVRTVPR